MGDFHLQPKNLSPLFEALTLDVETLPARGTLWERLEGLSPMKELQMLGGGDTSPPPQKRRHVAPRMTRCGLAAPNAPRELPVHSVRGELQGVCDGDQVSPAALSFRRALEEIPAHSLQGCLASLPANAGPADVQAPVEQMVAAAPGRGFQHTAEASRSRARCSLAPPTAVPASTAPAERGAQQHSPRRVCSTHAAGRGPAGGDPRPLRRPPWLPADWEVGWHPYSKDRRGRPRVCFTKLVHGIVVRRCNRGQVLGNVRGRTAKHG